MNRTKVVVSSFGAVCSAGRNVKELSAALLSPTRVFRPNTRHVLDFDVTVGQVSKEWFASHDHSELDSPTGRLCLAAARECVERAGVEPDGLSLGTSTGGQSENERVVFALLDKRDPGPFSFKGQGCMAAPARLVSRALSIEGPVQTVSTACTSSANAIALGAAWIRSGRCKTVLAGGGDALCHTTLASFKALELTGTEVCRPFGPDRPGLTLGEGAGFLLLQSLDDVLESGRKPIAEIVGVGMSSDAHHMTAPPQDGAGAELAMRRALQDAGMEPGDVCYVNAHGTGTLLNDQAEAVALERLFGSEVVVSSCKGLFGHTLGGAGALEAVASCLAIEKRVAFENLGADVPGEECPVILVGPGGTPLGDSPVILSNSFAFGGNNCSLVFAKSSTEVL